MTDLLRPFAPSDELLAHHGDRDVRPGLVDLAVNVRAGTPPAWLRRELDAVDLAAYPDATAAREAVAARHGRASDEVLLTAGAAEAFVLIARALRPQHAVVLHPQFSEPEIALRAAGHPVDQVVLAEPFTLEASAVPESADLVVIGNPTNPTSVLHPASLLRSLARPGRTLVVDEAFMDAVPGEEESLAAQGDLPEVIVIRSLTKTWGLAGLRAGYLLAAAPLVALLATAQPRWAVSAPALRATELCCAPPAVAQAAAWADLLRGERARLVADLAAVTGVTVAGDPHGPFLLIRTDRAELWNPLRDKGFVVRRGDTFPGLGPAWIRIAVRDRDTSTAFVDALRSVS